MIEAVTPENVLNRVRSSMLRHGHAVLPVARAMWEVRVSRAREQGVELEEWGDGFVPVSNGILEEAEAALSAASSSRL